MTHAYDSSYLQCAQQSLGTMLDYAVNCLGISLEFFYKTFLVSEYSQRFAYGESTILAGRSGIELAFQVLENQGVPYTPVEQPIRDNLSQEYWLGWALAYYQWYSGRTFQQIDALIPIQELLSLYHPYHEMDITQFTDVMERLCAERSPLSPLKQFRLAASLSQRELAETACVPLRTIQQYEQGQKKLRAARADTVLALARVLHCDVSDLLEWS